jgi:hypothetical protein
MKWFLKEFSSKVRNKGMGYSSSAMVVNMRVNSEIISLMAKASSNGQMVKSMKENGYRTKCLAEEL